MRQMIVSVLTSPGILLALLSVLLLAVLVTARAVIRRFHDFDQRLRALSETSEEQSRTLERLRRSLQETTEILERSTGGMPLRRMSELRPEAADVLRRELESLRSELTSEAPANDDAQPQQR